MSKWVENSAYVETSPFRYGFFPPELFHFILLFTLLVTIFGTLSSMVLIH